MTNRKSKLPLILGCFGVLIFLFILLVAGGFIYSTTAASVQSVVFIRSPQDGEILEADQPVQVRALARDDHKITRIELWIDGVLIAMEESNTKNGINPFPLLSTWYPPEGAHTIIVRAYNSRGNTSQASVTVGATALADRDMDGIADDVDACPDQAGLAPTQGCPDRDFDGIADSADACPDQTGLPPDGCPAPGEGDRDGDGFHDSADACPDEPGPPLSDGCPDADGDGVADASDACPAEPGGGIDGCPEAEGAPPPDPAPEELPPDPLPGEDPPVPEEEEPLPESFFDFGVFFFEVTVFFPVEIEAYELQNFGDYESVSCYLRIDDDAPHRYDFETLGDNYWDIAEVLGGNHSVQIMHATNSPLEISLNCLGSNPGDPPVNLGNIRSSHPPEEWDGRETAISDASLAVRYRICSPSCDESDYLAPLLAPVSTGPTGNGPYGLDWQWDGNESEIDGFVLTILMEEEVEEVFLPSNRRSANVADFKPACGETTSFSIHAYKIAEGAWITSPESNTVSWEGEPCDYSAYIRFTTLDLHSPPSDEGGRHEPGPIYGEFWVTNGSIIETIEFDACWCHHGLFIDVCDGLELGAGSYAITDIFSWINHRRAECWTPFCHALSYGYSRNPPIIQVPIDEGADITIGARIMDCDASNPNDVLFEDGESITINVDELGGAPTIYQINGDYLNLNYFIRMEE